MIFEGNLLVHNYTYWHGDTSDVETSSDLFFFLADIQEIKFVIFLFFLGRFYMFEIID